MKRLRLLVTVIGLLVAGMVGIGVCQLPGVAGDDAVAPVEVLRPLEKKDLGSCTTWLKKTGREDPNGVFRLGGVSCAVVTKTWAMSPRARPTGTIT